MKKTLILLFSLIAFLFQTETKAQVAFNVQIGYNESNGTYSFYPIINLSPGVDSSFISNMTYHWTLSNATTTIDLGTNSYVSYTITDSGTYNVCLSYSAPCCSNVVCTTIVSNAQDCSASFEAQYISIGAISLVNTSTYASGDTAASISWDFGNGQTSTEENPTVQYNSPFPVEVCLSIFSTTGCTDTHCQIVNLFQDTTACGVSFTSTLNANGSYTFSTNTDLFALITNYVWTCSNGMISTDATPTFFFDPTTNDSLSMCLTATYAVGCVATYCDYIVPGSTNLECGAAFIALNNATTVSFANLSQVPPGEVATYSWSFGDGTGSTTYNAIHEYAEAGTYTACLSIATSNGCTNTQCQTIDITTIIVDTLTCQAGFYYFTDTSTILFQNSSSSPSYNNTYTWTFGDGTASSEMNPAHTYSNTGIYEVCLTVATMTDPNTEQCNDTYCQWVSIAGGNTTNTLCGNVGIVGGIDSTAMPITFELYLIQYDAETDLLTAVDTITVDSWGNNTYYCFEGLIIGETYYIKAALTPDSYGYESHLPTYYGNSLSWQYATPFIAADFAPNIADITLISGNNPGGAGFVGGFVSDGAGRSSSTGMAGIEVILYDNNHNPIATTYTDSEGNYSFDNIPLGSYFVTIEYLGATSDEISINVNPSIAAANFIKNNDHFTGALILNTTSVVAQNLTIQPNLLAPNQAFTVSSSTALQYIRVVDLNGQVVFSNTPNSSSTTVTTNNWAKGYYICEVIDANGKAYRNKLVIQ